MKPWREWSDEEFEEAKRRKSRILKWITVGLLVLIAIAYVVMYVWLGDDLVEQRNNQGFRNETVEVQEVMGKDHAAPNTIQPYLPVTKEKVSEGSS